MTDEQAAALAKSCETALLKNDLKAVAFTDLLRRGLQKGLDLAEGHSVTPEEVDWQTLSLVEKSRFPGLEAFFFRVESKNHLREVLIGVDQENRVSVFGSISIPRELLSKNPEAYRRLEASAWSLTASFSNKHNLDGLLPFEGSAGSGGNRKDQTPIHFYVIVPLESWEALSFDQRGRILNSLEGLALNSYWLASKEWGNKEQIHITVIRPHPGLPRNINVAHSYAGAPPQELVLAERFVDIPRSYD